MEESGVAPSPSRLKALIPLAKRTFQYQIASSKQAARFMAGLCPYIDNANAAAF